MSGQDKNNYILSAHPDNTTATITPREVTITNVAADSKIYDGTTLATINTSNALINGIVNGDSLEIATGSANFDNKNAGNNKTVTFSDFGLSGDDKDNYTLSAQPVNVTANISPKTLTINLSVKDKEYDGTTNAQFDGSFPPAPEGFIDGDEILIGTAYVPEFDNKNVGENKPVFFPGFQLGGPDKDNYTLSQPENLTASITPKALTVTNVTVDNKVYDGTTTATFSKSNKIGRAHV